MYRIPFLFYKGMLCIMELVEESPQSRVFT